jgi:hypothetical protein
VVWWSGGLVVWWSGGLVVWWSGGLVVWWSGGLLRLSGELCRFYHARQNRAAWQCRIFYLANQVATPACALRTPDFAPAQCCFHWMAMQFFLIDNVDMYTFGFDDSFWCMSV